MYFTKQDLDKIYLHFILNSTKDTEFPIVYAVQYDYNTIHGDSITIVLRGQNKRIPVKDFINNGISLLTIDEIKANTVKPNALIITADKIYLYNTIGTTLQDIITNIYNRVEHISYDKGATIFDSDINVQGDIYDVYGNNLNEVNTKAEGWHLSIEDTEDPLIRQLYVLRDCSNSIRGDVIKIYKDSHISNVYLGTTNDTCNASTGLVVKYSILDNNEALCIVYHKEDGSYELVNVPLSVFATEAEFDKYKGLGVNENGLVFIKISSDRDSENYLHFDNDGNLTIDGILQYIDACIEATNRANEISKEVEDTYKTNEGTPDQQADLDGSRWQRFNYNENERNEIFQLIKTDWFGDGSIENIGIKNDANNIIIKSKENLLEILDTLNKLKYYDDLLKEIRILTYAGL